MNEPSTDDRLIGQLAASLREPPDDELARGLREPIDPVQRERLFGIMETSRASAPNPMPMRAANDTGSRWVVAGMILAAAAAVALWWVGKSEQPSVPEEDAPRVAVVSLPVYELEVDGGLATQRSDTPRAGGLRYRNNNQFTWVMRPIDNVAATVSTRLCASSQSGEDVEIDVGPFATLSESGGVRLQGRIAALGLNPGRWTVVLAVGVPEVLAEVGSVCRASTSDGIDVQRLDMQLLGD
jgi:hypothetical protein